MTNHCADNAGDRAVGEHWERAFCGMAADMGKMFTPHQIGRNRAAAAYTRGDGEWGRLLLPDVTIWSAPGEHHEIKHKNAARSGLRRGCYGLERYRLDALIRFGNTTGQAVYYTVHDWELAGAQDSREKTPNNIRHWMCADIETLSRRRTHSEDGASYVNGTRQLVEIYYWQVGVFFERLEAVWRRPPAKHSRAVVPPDTNQLTIFAEGA